METLSCGSSKVSNSLLSPSVWRTSGTGSFVCVVSCAARLRSGRSTCKGSFFCVVGAPCRSAIQMAFRRTMHPRFTVRVLLSAVGLRVCAASTANSHVSASLCLSCDCWLFALFLFPRAPSVLLLPKGCM